MWKLVFRNKYSYSVIFFYVIVVILWIWLNVTGNAGTQISYFFNWFYGLIALIGALYGIYISYKTWGGPKSLIGKGLIFLPLGLLSQWFGLQLWTYYNAIARIEVPYPSLADFGYFALIPAYSIGAFMFAQASGAKFSLRTLHGRLKAIVIPICALVLAYLLFIKNVGFDTSDPLKLFLDIAYPLGEIIPISIAVFTLTLSTNLLGGRMKRRILFLIIAFSFQFITEYAFLFAVGSNKYVNGGWNDLLYATSYTIMTLSLIAFSNYE